MRLLVGRDNIRVRDSVSVKLRRPGDQIPVLQSTVKTHSNVHVTLRDKPNGKIIEERRSHNIFLNYGREWLSELISLNTGPAPFRSDQVKYLAFGIGGTKQTIPVATIQGMYAGWSGYTTPTQTNTDPTVTGLEYPVEVASSVYYDTIAVPVTFPEAGAARFTCVLGYLELSYSGGPGSVPVSELGMFTESVSDLSVSPEAAPPERYMVAYNTIDPLSKTTDFVLQADWELRFA